MKKLRWYDFITYNLYWLGLNMGSGSLTPLILPYLVAQFAGQGVKNTAYGLLRAAGLIVAILVQPAAGLLSDRCTARWGRRRPFIAVGALLSAFCVLGVGVAPGYWWLFGIVLILQFASNIAQGALQGVISDVVPEEQRGRASAVKAIMELAPTILVALTIGRMVDAGQVWLAIAVIAASYVVTMLITVAAVRETPLQELPPGGIREPLLRVLGLLLGVGIGIVAGVVLGAVLGGVAGLLVSASAGGGQAWLVGVALGGLVAIVGSIIVGVWAAVHLAADARRYPAFTWWVVNRLLYLAAIGAVQGFALYFLKDVLQVPNPAGVTAQLMAVVGVLLVLSALPSGYLADRFGRRLLVAVSGIVAAGGILLLLVADSVTVVMIAGCLVGLATGVFMTVNWALGTDLVPQEEAGRFLGISNLAGAGAGIVASGLGGPLVDYFRQPLLPVVHLQQPFSVTFIPLAERYALQVDPALGYRVVFAIFGFCFLLSVVVLALVRQPAPAVAEGQSAASSTPVG